MSLYAKEILCIVYDCETTGYSDLVVYGLCDWMMFTCMYISRVIFKSQL